MLECLHGDKKVRDCCVRFVLPPGLGSVEIRSDVSGEQVLAALARCHDEGFCNPQLTELAALAINTVRIRIASNTCSDITIFAGRDTRSSLVGP